MPPFSDIVIKSYSERAVVAIDNSGRHEDSLLALGGKKNGGLTDKETGERFEGYIFPKSRLAKIEEWRQAGKSLKYTGTRDEQPYSSSRTSTNDSGVRQLVLQVEKIRGDVAWLREVLLQVAAHAGLEIEKEEEEKQEVAEPVQPASSRRPRMLG